MAIFEELSSNIGIIHLSDIHFTVDKNHLQDRWQLLYQALKDDFLNCSFVYTVISGDIANTGNKAEYVVAQTYLAKLLENLKLRYPKSNFRFVLAPGNHDCDFSAESQVRVNAVKNITYDTIGKDDSVIEMATNVQSPFWEFYGYHSELPNNKLYYRISDKIGKKSVCFHCLNTAWMSQKNEAVGTLFFPVKNIVANAGNGSFDVNIAVLHHPLNWFSPKTVENNKNELLHLLETISSMQIIGHEHTNELRKSENLDDRHSNSFSFSGYLLQDHLNVSASGFQTFNLNLYSNHVKIRRYRWQQHLYHRHSENDLVLSKKASRVVDIDRNFADKISKIKIPLIFNDKQITLPDLYVFPDLEKLTARPGATIDDYTDAETLISDTSPLQSSILEGDSQVGKTSLLCMLFLKAYEKGLYPILLGGTDLSSANVDKIIHKAFDEQYIGDDSSYEKFLQLDNKSKVLLIDDLHLSKVPKSNRHALIKSFIDLFPRTIITIDTAFGILPHNQSDFKEICPYSIKPLGYIKSGDLVDRYLLLKDPALSEIAQEHIDKSKHKFNQLRQVIGDKLIPSYPIYVLSIIQALEYTPLSLNETSYGYCYQTLIQHAFNSAGVQKDDIDSYVNIVTELAFNIFSLKTDSISESSFETFYSSYRARFLAPGFETIKTHLLNSKVLRVDSGLVSFGYKYILYFLAAKKIAEMVETKEGKAIVKLLYDNLHKEDNANILVFITHHTKSHTFIEDAILTAMLPFEKTLPITLKKDCHYNNLLVDVVKEIKQNVIEMNRDPSAERRKLLLAQDKADRKEVLQQTEWTEDDNANELIVPFIQAYRSIEIVGQIVRNRKGSLEKPILKEMLIELYNTGFRMVGYLGEMFRGAKDELASRIEEKITRNDSSQEIEMKVYKFLQFISLQACLGVFSKFIHSVGLKELRELYTDVADTMGTPAAKIVSFSINSYYGRINMKELEHLAKEFDGNMVALQILRARVKSYVYNNYVDYKDKQKISAYLKMGNISPTLGHKAKGY